MSWIAEEEFKEFVSERRTPSQQWSQSQERSAKCSHFYFAMFLRASVGFEINHRVKCHQRWNTLHAFVLVFQTQSDRYRFGTEIVRGGAGAGWESSRAASGLKSVGAASFPKIVRVRSGFKFCRWGEEADKNFNLRGTLLWKRHSI